METAFATFRGMEQNAMTRDRKTGWCYKNGGRAPYGYETYHVVRGKNARGKDIVRTLWRINPQQAEIVRLILVELRGNRQLSYVGIRDELNARGIPSPCRKNKYCLSRSSMGMPLVPGTGRGMFAIMYPARELPSLAFSKIEKTFPSKSRASGS